MKPLKSLIRDLLYSQINSLTDAEIGLQVWTEIGPLKVSQEGVRSQSQIYREIRSQVKDSIK